MGYILAPAPRAEFFQVEHSSVLNYCMALEEQSEDSPQSSQRSQRTAPQSASVPSQDRAERLFLSPEKPRLQHRSKYG
jgi:hypothetical protein